eukprot:6180189-Prymnesium_polylepis.1
MGKVPHDARTSQTRAHARGCPQPSRSVASCPLPVAPCPLSLAPALSHSPLPWLPPPDLQPIWPPTPLQPFHPLCPPTPLQA